MQCEIRIVLLTDNGLRHRFAASRLAKSMNLVGIVSEARSLPIAPPEPLPPADQTVIDQHFAGRDEVERRLLGAFISFPYTDVLEIPKGGVNSLKVFEWVRQRNPDMVVLYGTSIIKPPMLDFYADRIINLHLGLSPYYRGSGTNFWPLVNREPECVGATIHLAVASVDAGAILAQIRPAADISDRAHELGTKTIVAALDMMPRVLSLYARDKIVPQPQDLSQGRVFKTKDFNAEAVRLMWRNFDTGMMAEYVANPEARCRRHPIVELPEYTR
jgi:folate-dependent phosphoribosylglycinamide formyltransferase PurN